MNAVISDIVKSCEIKDIIYFNCNEVPKFAMYVWIFLSVLNCIAAHVNCREDIWMIFSCFCEIAKSNALLCPEMYFVSKESDFFIIQTVHFTHLSVKCCGLMNPPIV